MLPKRKTLPHAIPSWVAEGSEYFITICCRPKGENQLCRPDVAAQIQQAFEFYQQRGQLWAHLVLLMPDHLHGIFSFNCNTGMTKSIAEVKKYTARTMGISWQRDFFDHRLRKNESYLEKAHYIRGNPVRAGLCAEPEEWPYVWENRSR